MVCQMVYSGRRKIKPRGKKKRVHKASRWEAKYAYTNFKLGGHKRIYIHISIYNIYIHPYVYTYMYNWFTLLYCIK